MEKKQQGTGQPISKDKIFKLMLYLPFIVAGLFLLKNIIGGSVQGILVIGISLIILAVVVIVMRKTQMKIENQQFIMSMSLIFLVFVISINSGEYYSDDFPLYLAVIGLTGLYLRPHYTKIQMVLADIMLVIQYIIHPEKADSLSQFIVCIVVFTIAAYMFYLAINRGRAFIQISQSRAAEAEDLLKSLVTIGDELKKNFENSSGRIENLQVADSRLEDNAQELKQGSVSIAQGAGEVAVTCDDMQEKIKVTEEQIGALNDEVKSFELSLADNRRNMEEMSRQMESVKDTMRQTNEVFRIMDHQMQEISSVTGQLNSISSSTTMLALNASIEAARAGQQGAGFAVVASKVQELAVDSNRCSGQVADVVGLMQEQIQKTSRQLADSAQAINDSLAALAGLQTGFDDLTRQFVSLYSNIEAQNSNVTQVDAIFDRLKGKVAEMSSCSEENQSAVEEITKAMDVYKENIRLVIDDTRHVHDLSASMMDITSKK